LRNGLEFGRYEDMAGGVGWPSPEILYLIRDRLDSTVSFQTRTRTAALVSSVRVQMTTGRTLGRASGGTGIVLAIALRGGLVRFVVGLAEASLRVYPEASR
jgi:hypothetical protein